MKRWLFLEVSRSIIKSLKAPIKSIKGMLIAFESVAQREPAAKTFLSVVKEEISAIENVRNDLIALVERKKLRLKKQNLNKILFDFTSEIETSLRYKKIRLVKKASNLKLQVYVNKVAINNALHHLVGSILEKKNPVQELKLSINETSSYAMIGGTIQDSILVNYYQSDLSVLNSAHYHEYDLIDVINIMNNHFGDAKFRWLDNQLVEFILVFPKKLKLPWYLKDEPLDPQTRMTKEYDKSKKKKSINV